MINAVSSSQCRICRQILRDPLSRFRRVGPDCWGRLTPEERERALELAAKERDPHYVPPARRPSAEARANHAEVRTLTAQPADEQVCDRHGGVVGRCPQCRREADPTQAAARIIFDIQQERAAAREQAWQDRVAQALAVADG